MATCNARGLSPDSAASLTSSEHFRVLQLCFGIPTDPLVGQYYQPILAFLRYKGSSVYVARYVPIKTLYFNDYSAEKDAWDHL